MRNSLTILSILAILVSCKNEASQKTTAQTTASRPEFIIENFTDSTMEIPHSYISVKNGDSIVKIDTTTGSFQLMNAAEKEQEKMPASYILAGSAFWAGLREIIVIDSTAEGFVVKRQYQDSEAEGVEPFEIVKRLPK